nr:electron transport complex subunit RsxC [uncultured Desulfuromonas sp.]
MKTAPTFRGGIHLPGHKRETHQPIEVCHLPDQLVLPLSQHAGEPAQPCVAVGDRVAKGQCVATAEAEVSAPVHASTSGSVVAIEPRPHPSGKNLPAIVIKPDGEDRWATDLTPLNPQLWSPETLKQHIRDAGIVGMGGGTFPTHVKLTLMEQHACDTLVINGCECEPWLSGDDRLMVEQGDKVLDGADILRRALGVQRTLIGIEDNKPEAIALLRHASRKFDAMEIVCVPSKYPQGAEKQLIDVLLGRQVPSGGHPANIGVVVDNVATAAAVSDAVRYGRPLVERVVTIAGPALSTPKNLWVRLGTPLRTLIDQCGGSREEIGKIIVGGPMMGQSQLGLDTPVVKGTTGLLLFGSQDVSLHAAGPCIRCGRCIAACPLHLLPATITAYAERGRFDVALNDGALECMECGCCTYVCPAARPLVQMLRYAKAEISARQKECLT